MEDRLSLLQLLIGILIVALVGLSVWAALNPGEPVYRACSSGWGGNCIKANSPDAFVKKGDCLIASNGEQVCGSYYIERY